MTGNASSAAVMAIAAACTHGWYRRMFYPHHK